MGYFFCFCFPSTTYFQLANIEGISYFINPSETLGQLDEELNYTIRFSDVNLFNNNTPFQLILTATDNNVSFKNLLSSSASVKTITLPTVTGQSFSRQADNSYLYSGKIYYNLLSSTNVLSSKLVVNSNKNFANSDVNLTAVNSNANVVLSTFKSATPYPLEPDTLVATLNFTNPLIKNKGLIYSFSADASDLPKIDYATSGGQYVSFENGGNYTNGTIVRANSTAFVLNPSNAKYEYVVKIPYKTKGEGSFVFSSHIKRSTNSTYSSEPNLTINPIQTAVGFNPISLDGWQPNALVSDWSANYLDGKMMAKIIDPNHFAFYDFKISSSSTTIPSAIGFNFTYGLSSSLLYTQNAYLSNPSLYKKNNQQQAFIGYTTTPSRTADKYRITITRP